MTVVMELSEIINLLEAQLPANINSPQNQRLEAKLRRSLSRYFRELDTAFPYQDADNLYYRYVRESLESETRDILDSLLAALRTSLLYRLNGHLVAIYISGSAEMVSYGKTKLGLPIYYEGPPIEQAIAYTQKHCAKLVTQMDEETKHRLAQVIRDGIKNKRGIPGLQRDIRHSFTNMSKTRATMIARTETNDALSQAFMDKAHAMNIEGKEWLTFDPCPICEGNATDGVIPIDQSFSSGDMRPPAHPNCRCSLAPAMLSR